MIHPRWLSNAKAISATQVRFISIGEIIAGKSRRVKDRKLKANSDEFAPWRTPAPAAKPTLSMFAEKSPGNLQQTRPPHELSKANHMLVLEGLPTYLRSVDFQRLAGGGLSGWMNVINHVHQERDPWTLEPLGNYRISFSSSAAAALYEAKLERYLRLAKHKLRTKNSLWTSNLPRELRSEDPASIEAEVSQFSILPGSYSGNLVTTRTRVKGKWLWQRLMDKIVERSRFKTRTKPSAVLIELQTPGLKATYLKSIIDLDNHEQNRTWGVDFPYHLKRTLESSERGGDREFLERGDTTRKPLYDDVNFRQKAERRYVLLCDDATIAWQFIRRWNQRIIHVGKMDAPAVRHVITASHLEF
ncbi:hypothetical protein F66182_3201 [Fusarium sp. NRRL 66182]|nr:hypothetical protein F66182_3201 [Fusarium sp. NRRL 66182]